METCCHIEAGAVDSVGDGKKRPNVLSCLEVCEIRPKYQSDNKASNYAVFILC